VGRGAAIRGGKDCKSAMLRKGGAAPELNLLMKEKRRSQGTKENCFMGGGKRQEPRYLQKKGGEREAGGKMGTASRLKGRGSRGVLKKK